MSIHLERVLPADIEKRSFEIITAELGDRKIPADREAVVKRVIHTTADFEYADTLCFSENAVQKGIEALKNGATIVTDTKMAWSGVSKPSLQKLGGEAHCFISDSDVAETARKNGTTRAVASMDKAVSLGDNTIFAIGNAPTALVRLCELIREGAIHPKLVVGVPVGFVNVVESKELIMQEDVPFIVARGRKGGSNVAAAICNALLYQACGRVL